MDIKEELQEKVTGINKNVSSAIEDRLKNPVYGTFVISWVLFNWKALAIMLFETSITVRERIEALKPLGYDGLFKPYMEMIILPVFATILILLVMPYATLFPAKISFQVQNLHAVIKRRLLKTRWIEYEVHEKDINKHLEEIDNLKKEIREKTNFVYEAEKQGEDLRDQNAAVKRDLQAREENNDRLKKELEISKNEKALLESAKREVEEKLGSLKKEHAKASADLAHANGALEKNEKEIKELKAQIATVRKEMNSRIELEKNMPPKSLADFMGAVKPANALRDLLTSQPPKNAKSLADFVEAIKPANELRDSLASQHKQMLPLEKLIKKPE